MRSMTRKSPRRHDQTGFTLIEVMVAIIVLTLAFYGLAQVYARGRSTLRVDASRRTAIAVAQARLEQLRRDYRYGDLPGLDGSDTTFTVGQITYTVHHTIRAQTPEPQATTVTVDVAWQAHTTHGDVSRSLDVSSIIGRSLPWSN